MRNYSLKTFADIHVHMSDINYDTCKAYLDLLADQGSTDVALQSLTYRAICYNLLVLYWKENYKKINLSAFGMIHHRPGDIYAGIPYETQAKALLDMGCDGIKLMWSPDSRKAYGHGIDDERYEKMFTYLEENGVPLVIHVNDPEEFWIPRELTELEKSRNWGYFTEGYCTKQEIYDETFRMLDRHPKMKVTFAHFFFLSNFIDEAERVLETYPAVNFDLTPGWEMFLGFSKDIDAWQKFFIRYQDRILFGTDCNDIKNFNPQIYQLVREAISHDKTEFVMPAYKALPIRGLDLPSEVLEKICWYNYKKLVPETKKVNVERMLAAAKRLYSDIRDAEDEKIRESAAWTAELLAKYGQSERTI